ncbi:TonB-dependent receptor [candidate division KSB1 bacterium]|nr:TonB-dependent receptor [candidate division KSB1 bacterium]
MKRYLTIILLLFSFNTGAGLAGTIHGFVREKSNREPVIMGNVWIQGTNIGTTTNMKGYYVLPTLPPGKYKIMVRYIGFETKTVEQTIINGDDVTLDIYLEEEAIAMQEIVVNADRERRELDVAPGQIAVQAPQLRSIPQVAEADLFRAIQMLPGVATLNDFSAGLYVRGGSADQNLILLDNIDVYNPNHMFGFFSTFNPDAIKSVELLKGGFPAKYGGRMSSVLNVLNKEGNREEFQGVARVSLLSATTTLEGPWKKGSWMVSGRRTYLELAGKMVDFDIPYYFYDSHAKFNYDIDANNQASISFYAGNDILDWDNNGITLGLDWGNKTFSSQWTHLFSSKLFSHFVVAASRFDSDTKVKFDKVEFGISNEVVDWTSKGTLTYTPSNKHSMDFGFEVKYVDFDLNYLVVESDYLNSFTGYYSSVYAQDNYKLTPLTILQAGVRMDHYSDGNYFRFDPRISLKQNLTDQSYLTLSYGRFHQFLNMVQQQGMSFADMWLPVDHTFEPGEADHYILGYNYDNTTTYSINIEAYYKNYNNIAEFRTPESRASDETFENMTTSQNFLKGKGYAYGMDMYLRNNIWGFEGWLGYSLVWTKKRVNGFNYDEWYYPTYDRRNTFTLIEDRHLTKNLRLNIAFKYGTGQPFTEATDRYTAIDPAGREYPIILEGKMNAFRLPDYHRLDIGLFYTHTWFNLPWELFVQAVNVYNRDNVFFREYQLQYNPAKINDVPMLPFIPTFGFSVFF